MSVMDYVQDGADIDIALNNNIEITKPASLNANAKISIDLNGHNIINKSEIIQDGMPYTQIFIATNGILNISGNGNVQCDASQTANEDGYRMTAEARKTE